MKRYLFILLAIVSYVLNVKADDVKFSAIDTSKFKELRINFKSSDKIEPSMLSVFEEGKKLNFKLDFKEGKKAVFILIESSAVTHDSRSQKAIQRIVEGITMFCKTKHPNTDFAWGYYNRSDKNNAALRLISSQFQPISDNDIKVINDQINQPQVNSKWTDMLKATYESLDWISNHGKIYISKQLILIGTGKSLSESPIKHKECIERAKKEDIIISTIGLKSDDRYAFDNYNLLVEKNPVLNTNAESGDSIALALNNYLKLSDFNHYTIIYKSDFSADGHYHSVLLKMNGKEYPLSFVSPLKFTFIDKYLSWVIGIAMVVMCIIIMIILYVSRKRKKKRETEEKAKDEQCLEDEGGMDVEINDPINDPVSPPKRGYTQITVPPSTITIFNNGKNELIGIIQGVTSFGRNTSNNIVINNETVSSNHFTIEFNGVDCTLTNLSQSNGTIINGRKQSKSAIYSGDKVMAGTVEIFFN